MKQILLSIPEPCHENWNHMSPAEKGRFCASCSKQVVDFSLMNDAAITSYLNKATDKVCGRFDESQVNRTLLPEKNDNSFFKHLWKLLLPGFFFSAKTIAQKNPLPQKQGGDSVVRTNPKPMILGMVVKKITYEEMLEKQQIITGQVIDELPGEPVPGISIILKGMHWGTTTDSAGNFTIKISKQNFEGVLIISGVGFEQQEIEVRKLIGKEKQVIKIKMHPTVTGKIALVPVEKKPAVVKETYAVVNDKVKIYPNPVEAGNTCSLSFAKVDKGNYTAQVTDINGKTVQQSAFYVPGENYLFHLDLNKEIIAGAYLLRIINAAGELFYNGKIVVQ